MKFIPHRHPFSCSNSTLIEFISGSDLLFFVRFRLLGVYPYVVSSSEGLAISLTVGFSFQFFSIRVRFHLRIYFPFLEIAIGPSTVSAQQIYNNLVFFWWVCFYFLFDWFWILPIWITFRPSTTTTEVSTGGVLGMMKRWCWSYERLLIPVDKSFEGSFSWRHDWYKSIIYLFMTFKFHLFFL